MFNKKPPGFGQQQHEYFGHDDLAWNWYFFDIFASIGKIRKLTQNKKTTEPKLWKYATDEAGQRGRACTLWIHASNDSLCKRPSTSSVEQARMTQTTPMKLVNESSPNSFSMLIGSTTPIIASWNISVES